MTTTETTTWVDGRFVGADEPVIASNDRGLVGDGVFEAFKWLTAFPLRSPVTLPGCRPWARPLGITIDLPLVGAGIDAVTSSDRLRVGSFWLRITVTGGRAAMGKAERGGDPTVIVAAAPLPQWAPTCRAVVVPWTRRMCVGRPEDPVLHRERCGVAPRTSTGGGRGAVRQHRREPVRGVGHERLRGRRWHRHDATALFRCSRWHHPTASAGWHPEVVVGDIGMAVVLDDCEEMFVTSTSRDVHPVEFIDDRRLPVVAGPITNEIRTWFNEAGGKPGPTVAGTPAVRASPPDRRRLSGRRTPAS